MTNVVNTEAGATGRYINFGADPTGNDALGAQTVMAYCKPTAAGGGNFSYIWCKTPDNSTRGPRFYVDHNAGNPRLTFASDSSGGVGLPSRAGAAGEITYNNWYNLAFTFAGTVNASDIHLYVDGVEPTYSASTSGSSTLVNDTTYEMFLMNRPSASSLGRAFVGSIAWVARWNRVLNSTELSDARTKGPLAVPSGLVLCWANQQDYSASALDPGGNRSAHVDGDMPPNLGLGDSAAIDGVAAIAFGQTAALTGRGSLAGAAALTFTTAGSVVLGDIAGAVALAFGNNAVLTGAGALAGTSALTFSASLTPPDITISDAYERSSVNLDDSSVSGTGDDAIITIMPRFQPSEITSAVARWLEPSAKITGVNGIRPTFYFASYLTSGVGMYHGAPWQSTRRPMFSYDRETWTYFDTAVTVNTTDHRIEFRHSTAFTQDTVYVTRSRQMSVSQVGLWLEDMQAAYSSMFGPTPAAEAFTPTLTTWDGQDFIADEFSSQTNELGATIPATPFYAAQINDTSLMPDDGRPKRIAILTSGVHAGEDLANHVLVEVVNVLLGSTAWGQRLRRDYLILIYPCINAPGRTGGGWRGSFTTGTSGADDANRHFHQTGSALEIVDKPKDVFDDDLDGETPVWGIDLHGHYPAKWGIYIDRTIHTEFSTRLASFGGVSINNYGNTVDGFLSRYFENNLGARIGITHEVGDPSQLSDAEIVTHADAIVQTVDSLAGYFNHQLLNVMTHHGLYATGAHA